MVDRNAGRVREMFAAIAPRYDFLNRFLSLSIDRYWRWYTTRKLLARLTSEDLALDLCTGTGDLALSLSQKVRVVGCDFCHPMLVRGREKSLSEGRDGRLRFVEGDALRLPFCDGAFEAVSIAFGFRNLEDYEAGLDEMGRVLKAGGILAILEFSRPRIPVFRQLFHFYFTRILPRVGDWLSGREGPYSYLPQSVGEFPSPERLDDMIVEAGFEEVRHFPLTGGVAVLHLARRVRRDFAASPRDRVRNAG